MLLVIDANIIFSALLSPKGANASLIFFPKVSLISPEFLKDELDKHFSFMTAKSGRTKEDMERARDLLLSRVEIFSAEEYKTHLEKARQISPDRNDAEYFAVALSLNCPLWSNDKALKSQKEVKVFSTSELLQFLS